MTRPERTGGWGEGDPGDQGWGSGRHKGQRTRRQLVHVRGEESRRRENSGRHAGLRKLRLRGAKRGVSGENQDAGSGFATRRSPVAGAGGGRGAGGSHDREVKTGVG